MRRLAAISVLSLAWAASAASPAGAADWVWPVEGDLARAYDYGADPYAPGQHRGIDIAAAPGTPVRAATAGAVRFVGEVGSSGLAVTVRTADGRFDTTYVRLQRTSVVPGERVEAGEAIATTGTHLHFGVRLAGSDHAYRDPLDLLPAARGQRLGPAPRGTPVPVASRPVGFRARPAARVGDHRAVDPGWAVACLAAIALAVLLGRSSIGGSCRTTSQRRSTTSTASPTWATSTRR